MTDRSEEPSQRPSPLPPLAAENYTCIACGTSYELVTVDHAVEVISGLAVAV
ncbi:MAG: hypothetical protein ABI137_12480 [Antricoccus sp.]